MEDSHDTLRKLLAKDPSWEYGSLLPIATREGEFSLALPDIVREPIRSWMDVRDSFGSGQLSTHEGTEEMMPDVLNVAPFGAGGIMRGMGRGAANVAAQEVESPIYETLRWLERSQKPMNDKEREEFWSWHREATRKARDDLDLKERVGIEHAGRVNSLDRLAKIASTPESETAWQKHIALKRHLRKSGYIDPRRAEAEERLRNIQEMKQKRGIKDEWPGQSDTPPWPTEPDPEWSLTLDQAVQELDDMLVRLDREGLTTNNREANYRSNLDEIGDGSDLDPVHAEWNRRYELLTGIKPPTHGGNSTLHEGSSLPALLSAILAEDDRR